MMLAGDLGDHAGALGDDDLAGVLGGPRLDAGADVRRLGDEQRHRLLLHVGAHEGAVGVVVLDEGDERGRDRDDLLRRDVHQVDFRRRHEVDLARRAVGGRGRADADAGALRPTADEHAVADEAALGVERRRRLGDDVLLFLVGGEVDDLVGDPAVDDLAVRGLDEAVLVHPRVGGEVADQADVRAFGRLDRAHPAVVGGVHVTDLETGPLTRQPTRAERREAALVGEAGERVVLVHELRQLARAEELLDRGDDGADVDQGLRRDRLDVLGRHPLADDPLHPREADADLVLDQLADRADAPVGEVVLVVEAVARLAVGEVEHVGRRRRGPRSG